MLDFQPITWETRLRLAPYLQPGQARHCDATLGGVFLWRDYYQMQYAFCGDALCLLACYPPVEGDFRAFSFPLTLPELPEEQAQSARRQALSAIADYAKQKEIPLCFCPVTGTELDSIQQAFPGLQAEPCRQWFDYLYAAEDLRQLAGRKFGGQRNHINRFKKENPNWRFEKLQPDNVAAAQCFFDEYLQNGAKQFAAAQEENRKITEVLTHWQDYASIGFIGGVLFVANSVAAFSIGETVGDTLYVHTEKASLFWHGTYPAIVQQMALAYTDEHIVWVNREDDAGDDGLRTVKLSWHPARLIEKYRIQ